jgi:hypothetical protein
MVNEVEATLADMPSPPDQPTSLAGLLNVEKVIDNAEHNTPATNREIPVPADGSGQILNLLDERGGDVPAAMSR